MEILLSLIIRETNFVVFLFVFLHIKPLPKKVNSKRKEFAPLGSKFFPFKVDPFSKRNKVIFTE